MISFDEILSTNTPVEKYVPRIFGFRLYSSATSSENNSLTNITNTTTTTNNNNTNTITSKFLLYIFIYNCI